LKANGDRAACVGWEAGGFVPAGWGQPKELGDAVVAFTQRLHRRAAALRSWLGENSSAALDTPQAAHARAAAAAGCCLFAPGAGHAKLFVVCAPDELNAVPLLCANHAGDAIVLLRLWLLLLLLLLFRR
jgi:hypothetical protein